jgi:APA family basic amino acid/polyamine antiporter
MKGDLMHEKKIGSIALFAVASGTMISSGIFILPGLAYAQVGPFAGVVYLIAGIAAFLASLALVELSTAMPKAGGDYFYITRSMGPAIGTVMGLLSWVALMLKTAFAIFGIAELLFIFFGFPVIYSALSLTLLFLGLNLLGTSEAISFEVILVFILLTIMGLYVGFGITGMDLSLFNERALEGTFLDGFRSLFATAAFVFVSYGGLLNVTTMSEEVKNPGKAIPRAMNAAVILITLLYVAMVLITTGLLPPDIFSGSLTPIADGADTILGGPGRIMIVIASTLAFVTTGNAGLMSASRYPLAMARDGLIPERIGKVSKKGTPIPALMLTAVGVGVAVLMPLEALVKLASTVVLLTYIAINISVIMLRESGMKNYRPIYRIPGYPYVPVVALMLMFFFLTELGITSIEILILITGAGLLLYLLYGRKQAKYEFAALHVISRIINSQMYEVGLEDELREIIRTRDSIAMDITDKLLKDALLVEIDHPESLTGVFQMTASKLAPLTGLSTEKVAEALMEREKQFSTALNDFVSIPHIILPDQEKIRLTLVRIKEGVAFSSVHKSIKAMIIILGSEDKREEHLELLAGLSHLIQYEGFEQLWMETKDLESLKEQLILLDRKRVD